MNDSHITLQFYSMCPPEEANDNEETGGTEWDKLAEA